MKTPRFLVWTAANALGLGGLARSICGLVIGLVPTAILLMSLERVGLALSLPVEGFLRGFPVAALISGGALFAAIPERGSDRELSHPDSAMLGCET